MDRGNRRLFNEHGYVLPNRLVLLDSSLHEAALMVALPDLGDEGATITPDGSPWIADDNRRNLGPPIVATSARRIRENRGE